MQTKLLYSALSSVNMEGLNFKNFHLDIVEPDWNYSPSTIECTMRFDSVNTSPGRYDETFPQAYTLRIASDEVSTLDDVARIIVDWLVMRWLRHDIRESVRFGKFAPLHPHRDDGNNAWADTNGNTNKPKYTSVED